MFARFGMAIATGAAVTFGLLFLMQYLIATGRNAINDERLIREFDFVRVEREEVVETKQPKPEKPPEAERQPEMPDNTNNDRFDTALGVSMSAPTMGVGVGGIGLGMGASDGEYLPIVKVQPVYPTRALSRGLEGYVVVEYTVTAAGSTKDASVVESSSSIFERAAIESALKYEYRPRRVNGEAVEVPGVRTRITFELER